MKPYKRNFTGGLTSPRQHIFHLPSLFIFLFPCIATTVLWLWDLFTKIKQTLLLYFLLLFQIDCRLVNGFWQMRSLWSLLLSTSITLASHFNCVVKALAASTSCTVSRIITHPSGRSNLSISVNMFRSEHELRCWLVWRDKRLSAWTRSYVLG